MKSLYFVAGMLFGASITYLYFKNKEKLDKPVEIFNDEDLNVEPPVEESDDNIEDWTEVDFGENLFRVEEIPDRTIPYSVIDTIQKYRGFSDIYYISADDFGEEEDWDTITLTLYADGILADEDDSILSSPSDLVGDFEKHFGEEEEDVVYVKNTSTHCYYEIVRDLRKYEEIPRPHRGILNERYR